MGIKKLVPVNLAMFYGANKNFANAFSVRVTLKNPVEEEPLRRALDRAMARYPYFSVRLRVGKKELYLEDNPLPVSLVKGPVPAPLNTAASNYHLVGLSWEKASIVFGAFHGLTDGAGAFPWIKTVLYYYLCETEGKVLDPKGIRLAGETIPEEELEDPFPQETPAEEEILGVPHWKDALCITEKTPVGRQVCYRLRIGETSFMKYTRAQDGSPATITSAFMAKALFSLYPDTDRPIVCGMAHNIRDALQKPLAHQSMVSLIQLVYPPRLKDADIMKLAMCSRGMVMLQSRRECVLQTVRRHKELEEKIKPMTLEEKFALLRPHVTGARTGIGNLPAPAPVTFKVSYVGRTDWGSMAPMIESVHCSVTTDGSGIAIEINTGNGYFDCCFMQEFEDDTYIRAFADILEKEGVYCTVSGPFDIHIPKMRLPDEPENGIRVGGAKEETDMTITKKQEGDRLTVALEGRLDTNTSPALDGELRQSLDGVKELVLDFTGLEYLSSAGLRVLLGAQKTMNKQGSMVLHGVNDAIMEIFEITGFADILTIE